MTDHVDKLWASFRDEVLSTEAGHAQVLEMKRAFFAGALSMWTAVMGDMFEAGDDEPTEQDMRRMSEIQSELVAFGRSGGRL